MQIFPCVSVWRTTRDATTCMKAFCCSHSYSFIEISIIWKSFLHSCQLRFSCTCLTSVSKLMNKRYYSLFQGVAHHLGLWMMCPRQPHTRCRLDFECNRRLALNLAICPEVSSHCGDGHKAALPCSFCQKRAAAAQITFSPPINQGWQKGEIGHQLNRLCEF